MLTLVKRKLEWLYYQSRFQSKDTDYKVISQWKESQLMRKT